eukprot:GDKK01002661.1.p1 GENE.GDKK01002661.1~~GDKK01002661.1.p1  ORF type:complete len:314 (+),score=46.87 GDKK01002661.1:60-1001(+)
MSFNIGDFPFPLPTETIHVIAKATYGVFEPAMTLYQETLTSIAPEQVKQLRDFVASVAHPFSKDIPLMDPIDLTFLLVVYFVLLAGFFLVGRVTGKLELRTFGIVYNAVCVVVPLSMSVGLAWEAYNSFDGLWNNPVDSAHPRAFSIRNILWVFYISKLLEYTDTYIMVLKHNYRQVSFLHLYHHTSIVVVVYSYLIIAPGGDSYWCSMVNSGVHVVMYLYYLLNLLFREGPVKRFLQANKLIITFGQLTQFVLNLVQALFIIFVASPRRFPASIMWEQVIYMATMIVLFGNFLVNNKSSGKKGGSSGKKKRD